MELGNVENFLKGKPDNAKISVTYNTGVDYLRGYILDNQVHKSITGNYFIHVNNEHTRILVSHIRAMSWSGLCWEGA